MTLEAGPESKANWLPAGEEPHALGNITHLTVLRNAGLSALSLPSGEIDAATESSTGLYFRDTRILSKLHVTLAGVVPTLLDARQQEHALTAIFTNPAIRSPAGDQTIERQTLVLRRRRVIAETMLESLSISNYSGGEVDLDLRVEFEADFADIFVIRGYERESPVPPVTVQTTADEVCFAYEGLDGVRRATRIVFHTAPQWVAPGEVSFVVRLKPRETIAVDFEVCPGTEEPCRLPVETVNSRVQRNQAEWLAGATAIETDHELVNSVLQRSLLDIYALLTRLDGGGHYVAAGVPWFDTLFGRDSLITGIEMVAFNPQILEWALLNLARYQATERDPVHDAEPGKIPHELRWDELAGIGEVPFARYYGSVDVTPLFIVAADEYLRWTADVATIRQIWPNLQRALAWCELAASRGVNGFIGYSRLSERGLENQGWKDSHDAIRWPDGRMVEPPIALVEVQAYMAAAYSAFARLAAVVGDVSGMEMGRRATAYSSRIDREFGHDELGYVLALDGAGRQVPTPASNSGHVLWAGVARPDLAEKVGAALLNPDMFSGWGIRTLSSSVAGYNPLGYHLGTVWPHDNALALAGLRWYGFDDKVEKLSSALIHMALDFPDYRVPELFSGDDRDLRLVPTPYPVASRPQAWAAASMPYVISSLLGVRPGKPGQLSVVCPMLPKEVKWLRLRNLRFAGGSAGLLFHRHENRVSVEVEDVTGDIEIVLAQTWPEETFLLRI